MQPDLVAILEQDMYRTREADAISAALTRLTLRAVWQIDPRTDTWLAVTPYGGQSASGVGGALGVEWIPKNRWWVQAQLMAYQPWDESTYSVYYDGYFHGASALVTMPVTERLSLTMDGAAQWYYLGPRSPASTGYYARSLDGGIRADYLLYRGLGRVMSVGFRDRYALRDDSLSEGLITYASLRRKDTTMGGDNAEVPVITNSFETRLGAEYTHVFNEHWGAVVGGYFGRDPGRGFEWSQLYGYNARLVFVASDSLRLWVGTGMDSETATGVDGGRTSIVEFGLNVNF
jgi:hypothetical protein